MEFLLTENYNKFQITMESFIKAFFIFAGYILSFLSKIQYYEIKK